MSVLVPSFPSSTSNHYFPNRRINGNPSQPTKHMSLTNRLTSTLNENKNGDIDSDHVPFGVVNSMKQRLLDKVNESLLLNNNTTLVRQSLSKSSSRILSNDNLLQTKPSISPLKRSIRLSRSQDNLSNNNSEQYISYLQPKQDVIIVDRITSNEDKIQRHSYIELHVDEVPKPGTVSTVKNMFERQIRLSRFDSDKLSNASIPISSRANSQHREMSSPTRSRSISPNDMALRQRRTAIPGPVLPSTATTLLLPVPTTYPDLVISHTPPASSHIETNKITNEQSVINTHNENRKKDSSLNVTINDTAIVNINHHRPNLLLPSTPSSDTAVYQPLDFKSRLALFNRTNTMERSNEHSNNSTNIKKPSNVLPPASIITKPTVHHYSTKKDIPTEMINNQIARSIVNTAKAVTFFGGTKTNENSKSTLPKSIAPPPPPIIKDEQSSVSPSIDLLRAPDIIGGNVKLNKSSIFSGAKKDARVQFIDDVDTFEYPSFDVAMAELGTTDSDDDENENSIKKTRADENVVDDVDDDELERLARVNANFNSNNLTEKPLQSKGTLHTFRPTNLGQYELGTQHALNSSDNHSILNQQKSPFEMTNNIQWSSMSTTTDLLF